MLINGVKSRKTGNFYFGTFFFRRLYFLRRSSVAAFLLAQGVQYILRFPVFSMRAPHNLHLLYF